MSERPGRRPPERLEATIDNNANRRPVARRGTKRPEEDIGGRRAFIFLLVLIPVVSAFSIIYLLISFEDTQTPRTVTQVESRPAAAGTPTSVITTTLPYTPTANLGAFDTGLFQSQRFALGAWIFMLAAIIETSLLLVYGAFYVNDPRYSLSTLGLPPGTVRVFLLIIVVLAIFMFALLPAAWGDNKAVVLLFGILSTVVGFYYGSRKDEGEEAAQLVKLSIVEASKLQEKSSFTISGRMGAGYDTRTLGRAVEIAVYLVASNGQEVVNSERIGLVDSSGSVEFDYTDIELGKPGTCTTYIVRVRRPEIINCDDRLLVDLSKPGNSGGQGAPTGPQPASPPPAAPQPPSNPAPVVPPPAPVAQTPAPAVPNPGQSAPAHPAVAPTPAAPAPSPAPAAPQVQAPAPESEPTLTITPATGLKVGAPITGKVTGGMAPPDMRLIAVGPDKRMLSLEGTVNADTVTFNDTSGFQPGATYSLSSPGLKLGTSSLTFAG